MPRPKNLDPWIERPLYRAPYWREKIAEGIAKTILETLYLLFPSGPTPWGFA